eukprot:jgi/Undpi1/1883/HiC_scaffold_12.g05270.m1
MSQQLSSRLIGVRSQDAGVTFTIKDHDNHVAGGQRRHAWDTKQAAQEHQHQQQVGSEAGANPRSRVVGRKSITNKATGSTKYPPGAADGAANGHDENNRGGGVFQRGPPTTKQITPPQDMTRGVIIQTTATAAFADKQSERKQPGRRHSEAELSEREQSERIPPAERKQHEVRHRSGKQGCKEHRGITAGGGTLSPDISATPGTQKYPSRWSDSRPRPSGDRRRPQSAGALTPSARRTATCRNSARKFPARSPARGDILRGWKVGVGVGVGGVVGVGGGVGGGGGGSSNGRGIDSLRASGRGPQLGKSNAPAKSTEKKLSWDEKHPKTTQGRAEWNFSSNCVDATLGLIDRDMEWAARPCGNEQAIGAKQDHPTTPLAGATATAPTRSSHHHHHHQYQYHQAPLPVAVSTPTEKPMAGPKPLREQECLAVPASTPAVKPVGKPKTRQQEQEKKSGISPRRWKISPQMGCFTSIPVGTRRGP